VGGAAIVEALKVNSSLLELGLGFNQIGESCAAAIAASSILQELDLRGTLGAAAIAEALKMSSSRQKLDLGCSSIGDSGAAAIANALKVNSILLELDLGGGRIGAVGATAIAEALKVNASLQKLDLDFNKVGDSGAAAFAEALKVNSCLQELGLFHSSIRDSGAVAIAKALKLNSSMQNLDLRCYGCGNACAASFEESLEYSLLGFDRNAHFPEVLLYGLQTPKHRFLYALSEKGFRSFVMNDVPPYLWPYALAKVGTYPSFIFHLLLQIPGILHLATDSSERSTRKRLKIHKD
jgi:hypothetical protein